MVTSTERPQRKVLKMDSVLEGLNYTIEHVKGVENAAEDFLSRVECEVDQGVNDTNEFFERHVYSTNFKMMLVK